MSSGLLSALAAEMVSHQFAWVATADGTMIEVSGPLARKIGNSETAPVSLPVDDPTVITELNERTLAYGAADHVTTIGDDIFSVHQVAVEHEGLRYIAGWGEVLA